MNWKKVKLGELIEEFSVRAKNDGGAKNLEFFGVSNEEGITISKYAAEEKAEDYKIIEKGCFAYNPYRINVGSIAYLSEDTKGLISPAYIVFKTKPKSIIPELLLKFLKSFEGLRQIRFYGRGTVRQALRFEDLCNIELSIPSFDEQKLFFEKIKSVDNEGNRLFKDLDTQLVFVKQLRQAFLREAMQGKLIPQNPNDEPASELLKKIKAEKLKLKNGKKEKPLPEIKPEEIPFEIPKNWVWCKLGEISELNGRIGWKGLSASEYKKEGPLFLSVHGLNYGDYVNFSEAYHISQERYNESPEIMLKNNDILICKDGAGIGKLGIVKNLKQHATINSSLLLIRINNILNHKYVYFYLLSNHFQKIVNSRIMGATTPHLYQRDLIHFTVPLPPLLEQKRIVSKLEELMKFCDDLELSIKQSKEQVEKLLQTVLREVLTNKS